MARNRGKHCLGKSGKVCSGAVVNYSAEYAHNDRYHPDWQIVDRYRNVTRDNMPMDETITSFADRVIDLFEMINEQNGGGETLLDNRVAYKIPVEQPAPAQLVYLKDRPIDSQQVTILFYIFGNTNFLRVKGLFL